MIEKYHRDVFDSEYQFRQSVTETSFTAGATYASLDRCGLRMDDLRPWLCVDDGETPDWMRNRGPLGFDLVELVAKLDYARLAITRLLVARHRHEQGGVVLRVFRSDADALRTHLAEGRLRDLQPEPDTPAFAALHRVASYDAARILVEEHGVFATVAFDNDPHMDGYHYTENRCRTADVEKTAWADLDNVRPLHGPGQAQTWRCP